MVKYRHIFLFVGIATLCGISLIVLRGLDIFAEAETPFVRGNHKVELPYFDGYQPVVFKTTEAVPPNIIEYARAYLRSHLPKTMLQKTSFREGCIIEREKLLSAGFRQEAAASYVFIFTIRIDTDTIGDYDIAFCIDDKGRVLDDARLPPKKNEQEFAIATKEQILLVAKRELGSWKYAELTYSSEHKIWAWRFVRVKKPIAFIRDESRVILEVDASSGNLLSKREIAILR